MQKWRNRCINSAVCSGIETSSEVANSVPVFREEGFIEESSFLVDVSLCGNENCRQIELGERYYPPSANHRHLRILLFVRVSRQVLKLRIRCPFFREEGFIEESSFLVDVSLCGNENCKQIELGERYYPQAADHGHLRILLFQVVLCLAVVEQVCPEKTELCKSISLSRRTLTRRVEMMAEDSCKQLRDRCRNFIAFSLAIDESVDITGTPQTAVFVRGLDATLQLTEELLDLVPMTEGVTGETMFSCIDRMIQANSLDFNKLVSVATDGAPVMAGELNGFVGRIKRKIREV
ncbi:uncharacterized protein LOC114882122 isoform X2 [Osmia bicornis bicornis]|uniref:uncharacterized protein LOC114882122 isoform X2 n=1 Tax=Osmia bicornis bicornis TaxID=1437191 RepID=UPI001EAE9E1D|nr:uncharacterized protein LOC114882122 isoform X2 [Osmia bicornis bicornis]